MKKDKSQKAAEPFQVKFRSFLHTYIHKCTRMHIAELMEMAKNVLLSHVLYLCTYVDIRMLGFNAHKYGFDTNNYRHIYALTQTHSRRRTFTPFISDICMCVCLCVCRVVCVCQRHATQ